MYLDSMAFQLAFKEHKWVDLDYRMFEQLCSYQFPLVFFMLRAHEYLEQQKFNKYCIEMNVNLGCENNLIKNYKTFDYIKLEDGTFKGVGISSIYIPVDHIIEQYGLDNVVKEL